MYQIHPNARTTPAVRAEIARSTESSGELAKRYSVSTETIRKWRKRGAEDCRDHSSRPTHLRGGGPPTKSAPLSAICAA
jgi:transposase-like protein